LRARVIACETVGEEIKSLLPEGVSCRLLQFGLHLTPEKLNATLQEEIDATPEEVDTILLGYGMCSKGAIGLQARRARLVVPRVDDCIGLLLGSRAECIRQRLGTPGTFYLTRGWIECGDDPYTEYLKMREKYGEEKAHRLEKMILENYTRIALITSNGVSMEEYRRYARKVADLFGLTFEELPGSQALLKKLVAGHPDDDLVIVEPGGRVEYEMFLP